MKTTALYDRAELVATLSGSVEDMIAQAKGVVAGRAYDSSVDSAVRDVAESGATMSDLPERSESGRCWSRWTVRKA